MCEILTLQHNEDGLKFTKQEITEARNGNPHGAGYVIFDEISPNKWDIVDMDIFQEHAQNADYHYYNGHYYSLDGYDTLTKKQLKKKKKSQAEDIAVAEIYKKQSELKPNQLLIAHFRLATSGLEGSNTQPIIEGDYCVIHNGIFPIDNIKGFSDTKTFTHTLNKDGRKIKSIKAERKLINKLIAKVGGMYSIFIYSFKTKKLYYIKNKNTSFHFAYNGIMGSTLKTRIPLATATPPIETLIEI